SFTYCRVLPFSPPLLNRVSMLKRIFGLLSVTILLSTLSIGSASAEEGQVTDDTQGLIAQIRSSDDPFATLDSFPQDAQDLILPELSKLSDIEANDLFKYQISASPFTAMAAAYYTDIAWSAVEKAACVIHVDLLSCNGPPPIPALLKVRQPTFLRLQHFTMRRVMPSGIDSGTRS